MMMQREQRRQHANERSDPSIDQIIRLLARCCRRLVYQSRPSSPSSSSSPSSYLHNQTS